MSEQPWDVIVVGAGPAGASAAAAATDLGMKTLVIDEAAAAGGQVYRQSPRPKRDIYTQEGDALRQRLRESGATFAKNSIIWNIARSSNEAGDPRFEVSILNEDGPSQLTARSVIVASGATERFYARPGWQLPGVVGLGAATVMLKSAGILPGRRVVVAGAGPLLSLVAHLLIEAGAEVAAMVDLHPFGDWLKLLPRMASRPDLLWRGMGWQLELKTNRVPTYYGFDVREIHGQDEVTGVTLGRPGEARTIRVDADAVCIGHGLVPSTEIYRLLGVGQRYERLRGGWIPQVDEAQRTNVPRVYGAGDSARLLGAAAAPLQGELAALAAARDLGFANAQDIDQRCRKTLAQLHKASSFGSAMAEISAPWPEAMAEVPDHTIVCRCEDISAAQVRTAIAGGARSLNALKSATRCGMGPCGGRSCSASAAGLMQCAGIAPEEIGQNTARPPLRPISLAAISGDFAYSDIPFPEPSPV